MPPNKYSGNIDACFLPNVYQISISSVICRASVCNGLFDLLMSHAWLLPLIYGSPVTHQLADLEKARKKR